eukprot:g20666.t1
MIRRVSLSQYGVSLAMLRAQEPPRRQSTRSSHPKSSQESQTQNDACTKQCMIRRVSLSQYGVSSAMLRAKEAPRKQPTRSSQALKAMLFTKQLVGPSSLGIMFAIHRINASFGIGMVTSTCARITEGFSFTSSFLVQKGFLSGMITSPTR